jgi:hypothetical protein
MGSNWSDGRTSRHAARPEGAPCIPARAPLKELPSTGIEVRELTNPASPFFADQTWLYSGKQWVDMRFTEADIASDPNLSVMMLQE